MLYIIYTIPFCSNEFDTIENSFIHSIHSPRFLHSFLASSGLLGDGRRDRVLLDEPGTHYASIYIV